MALPYLSTSRASLLIPELGELGIVPMAPLPLIAIQQPAGVGSTTWSVPNQPALAGLQVYAQALLVNFPLRVSFTNVTMDVLLP